MELVAVVSIPTATLCSEELGYELLSNYADRLFRLMLNEPEHAYPYIVHFDARMLEADYNREGKLEVPINYNQLLELHLLTYGNSRKAYLTHLYEQIHGTISQPRSKSCIGSSQV